MLQNGTGTLTQQRWCFTQPSQSFIQSELSPRCDLPHTTITRDAAIRSQLLVTAFYAWGNSKSKWRCGWSRYSFPTSLGTESIFSPCGSSFERDWTALNVHNKHLHVSNNWILGCGCASSSLFHDAGQRQQRIQICKGPSVDRWEETKEETLHVMVWKHFLIVDFIEQVRIDGPVCWYWYKSSLP